MSCIKTSLLHSSATYFQNCFERRLYLNFLNSTTFVTVLVFLNRLFRCRRVGILNFGERIRFKNIQTEARSSQEAISHYVFLWFVRCSRQSSYMVVLRRCIPKLIRFFYNDLVLAIPVIYCGCNLIFMGMIT